MSTVVNKNIKLDTKIILPKNFVGLIYYNDKYLFTLKEGEYKFQGDTFYKVVEKNAKRNRNIKKPTYNFNLHYVNISRQKIETFIGFQTAFRQKDKYTLRAIYEIVEPKAFADEILLTWYKTNNTRTLKIVKELFNDFCYEFLRKKLKKQVKFNEQMLEYAKKYFKSYGINICDISLTKTEDSNSVSKFFENQTDSLKNGYTEDKQERNFLIEEKVEKHKKYCPNCQSERIEGADYCHKCGYRFY